MEIYITQQYIIEQYATANLIDFRREDRGFESFCTFMDSIANLTYIIDSKVGLELEKTMDDLWDEYSAEMVNCPKITEAGEQLTEEANKRKFIFNLQVSFRDEALRRYRNIMYEHDILN